MICNERDWEKDSCAGLYETEVCDEEIIEGCYFVVGYLVAVEV